MLINAYLSFKGQCEQAMKFYAECLGGKVEAMIPYEGTPMANHMPADWRNKIMHARVVVGDQAVMASDPPPDRFEQPKGFSMSISLADTREGERIFNALAAGGQVQMPFQPTFWAAGFGMCMDRFGISWLVNCEKAA